jgi:UDP-GlcNAc3NAcA epimerase
MITILTVVGARPQIIKAAALSRIIRQKFSDRITEYILHTGQHYDQNMSQVFFDELSIPEPDFNLEVGSGEHGRQTAQMIEGIEKVLKELTPDFLVVYGDTNSTLAGAIAASKVGIDIIHIEAGLRSFNKTMPEEINRIMCDHVSTLLFSPTETGIKNLISEGFRPDKAPPYNIDRPAIFHCGDVMYDNSLHFAKLAGERSDILSRHNLKAGEFILGTIHRNNNTDDKSRFTAIFDALNTISRDRQITVFLPLHPRAQKQLKNLLPIYLLVEMNQNPFLKIAEPVSFLDMIQLEKNAVMIVTDSGGVQKEAYFFQKPSVILRPQTEWVEIVEQGAAMLADADKEKIIAAFDHFSEQETKKYPPIFGDGRAAEFICEKIIETHHYSG